MVLAKSIIALVVLMISPLSAYHHHHDPNDVVIKGSDLKHILRELQKIGIASTMEPEERKTAEYELIVNSAKTVTPTAIIEEETKNQLDSDENHPDQLTWNDLKPGEPEDEITIVSAQTFDKPTAQKSSHADQIDNIALKRASKKNMSAKPCVAVEEDFSLK